MCIPEGSEARIQRCLYNAVFLAVENKDKFNDRLLEVAAVLHHTLLNPVNSYQFDKEKIHIHFSYIWRLYNAQKGGMMMND